MTERDLAQAFAYLAASVAPIEQVEHIALSYARGRILAAPLVSQWDLPTHDLAAMDGYAVRAQDLAGGRNILRVVATILAGHPFPGRIGRNACARIMTGAPMPEGSDAVVVMEVVQALAADTVAVPGPVPVGANRRLRGEHVRAGDTVLSPGRRLRMAELALASAIGAVEVAVYRRLRVGVLSTGDELRDPPADLRQNGAYDSNRPMLLAAVEGAFMAGFDLGICPDDSAALARFIEVAFDQRLDSLLISGGAALGDADVVRALAGVEFVPVNARPGRGIAVARLVRMGQGLLVLGLPGNAVAAYVVLHALALPLLARMAGSDARPPAPISMPIARDLRARAGRIDFLRARLTRDSAGRQVADPLAEQGSAMIRSVCDADALIAVGPAAEYRAGELLPVYLLETFEIQR